MITKFLRFCIYLLQLMIAVVLLDFVCREMTGEESLISILRKPVGDPTHSLMVVCLLLLLSLFIGFSAVWKAWRTISKESAKFEQRREYDLKSENWSDIKDDANTVTLVVALAKYAHKYGGGDSHHYVRFKLILESVCHPGGRLPSLGDLRALTYAAEAARRPVWMLRVVVSILLIIGILGTLVGVHAAIDGNNFSMEKLPTALIPSSFAVTFTVLLIICRGVYRKKVDEYIGRLDRHTVSFYFPFFRPAEESSVQLHEITETLASFSGSVKGMAECIDGLHDIHKQLNAYGEVVNKAHMKLNTWQRDLPLPDAEAYARVVDSLCSGYKKTLDLRDRLLNQIKFLAKNFNYATSRLSPEDFERFANDSTPFSETVETTHQHVVQIPYYGDAAQHTLKARWTKADIIDKKLSDVVAMGGYIAGSLSVCVKQAESSAGHAVKTAKMYAEMMAGTKQNLSDFVEYRTKLDGVFADACKKLKAQITSLETNCVKKIQKNLDNLKDRESKMAKEPTAYWYEIAFMVLAFALLWWNVSLTIGKFVIGYDE